MADIRYPTPRWWIDQDTGTIWERDQNTGDWVNVSLVNGKPRMLAVGSITAADLAPDFLGSIAGQLPGAMQLDGEDGEDGWPGPPGIAGATGATGAAGAVGATGMGSPGRDGEDADDIWYIPGDVAGAAASALAAALAADTNLTNLDGGSASSTYGSIVAIDGGSA